jgi:hypothetical protein
MQLHSSTQDIKKFILYDKYKWERDVVLQNLEIKLKNFKYLSV